MNIARIASLVHKWLALLIGIQIVFWVVSGLFFTLYPIEQIRSEHLIRPAEPRHIETGSLDFSGLRNSAGAAPVKLTIENRPYGQVVLAEFADGDPILYDAATLQPISPISRERAVEIARGHIALDSEPTAVERITEHVPEYHGLLPAWRVRFAEHGMAVYVADNTGAVTGRRSDLWRIYDTLWALHIMDWENHEDFNHPLIVIVAWLTLFSVIAGIALIPYRFRWFKNSKAA
ncbi:MAG TPA: PepSY domain-containing protein [Terricaulis sp.]|nr:PepSY domain-containing protein [Terricaulis sp.]HRP10303.1 PepSY domain-containing protein [Terricaulis sp.]